MRPSIANEFFFSRVNQHDSVPYNTSLLAHDEDTCIHTHTRSRAHTQAASQQNINKNIETEMTITVIAARTTVAAAATKAIAFARSPAVLWCGIFCLFICFFFVRFVFVFVFVRSNMHLLGLFNLELYYKISIGRCPCTCPCTCNMDRYFVYCRA